MKKIPRMPIYPVFEFAYPPKKNSLKVWLKIKGKRILLERGKDYGVRGNVIRIKPLTLYERSSHQKKSTRNTER